MCVSALLLAALIAAAPPASTQAASLPTAINAVWGDASWEQRYGAPPTLLDAPSARVRVHLEAVLDALQGADLGHLAPATRARRHAALDSLAAYVAAEAFPVNTSDPMARPVLIDAQGRLCAVGHMVAETAGRDALVQLDRRAHFANLWELSGDPALAAWAEGHGFTAAELAAIQPAYPPTWHHPRHHTKHILAGRMGLTATPASRVSVPGATADVRANPSFGAGLLYLFQPGTTLAVGAAFTVQSDIDDATPGGAVGVFPNLAAEYALLLDRRGDVDLIFIAELGPAFVAASARDFVGINYAIGAGVTFAPFPMKELAVRVDLRTQGVHLSGSGDSSYDALQFLAHAGLEWRFNL